MKTSFPVRIAVMLLCFTFAWMIFEHIMGYNTTRHDIGQFTRLVPALIFWIAIFFTVRNEKRKTGKLTFLDGWKAGIISSFIYFLGFTLLIILYQQFVNREFYETFRTFRLAELQAHHATQAQIDSAMKELEFSYNGSLASYALLFVFSFVWGTILSAVAALIFKSKNEVVAD